MIENIYNLVEQQYFSSSDFNGLPIYSLKDSFDIESEDFKKVILFGIENEFITATFNGNTHIKPFSDYDKNKIAENFKTQKYPSHICLYPHEKKLALSDKLHIYQDSPYNLELAKGAGQLDFRTFDLSILEYYRNDPRYYYSTNFIHGKIGIEDEYYDSGAIAQSDQVILKTFGFAYDDDLNRYVAVFLRYLSNLSPEHQRVWSAKEVKGNIKLHPDYYASSIHGSWGTRISIFEAFVQEMKLINEMCELIGKPKFFKNCYSSQRPKEFGFLLRPTESEFNSFIHLLDKMMADNIDVKFFENDVELESEEERKDGKIVVSNKGTIQILASWINKYFEPVDTQPIDSMIATFKKVRKLRQKPAHKVNIDQFNQDFFRKQREIIISAYNAVRTLRLILSNHPEVKANPPKINEMLLKGEIWDI